MHASPAVALRAEPIESDAPHRDEVVRALQERIRGMQRTRLDSRALPTHEALTGLLPGGALAAGGSYAVDGSTTLALGLAQGPSAAGAWCAIVGMPDLGIEAVAGLGLDLERVVLVPHPGEQWLSVVSALVDVVTVVIVRPPRRASGAVTASSWVGLGSGFGHLQARQVSVASSSKSWAGRPRSRRLWLPGPEQQVAVVEARNEGAARRLRSAVG